MRDLTWCEYRIPGAKFKSLVTDIYHVSAFKDVKPLVLFVMNVLGGSSLRLVGMLDDIEIARRLNGRHLCIDPKTTEYV